MVGYFTSKKSSPSFKKPRFVARSTALPVSPQTFTYQHTDTDVVTSYRTRDDQGVANKSFGRRDPFEVFYAYGSWRFDNGHPFQVDHYTTTLSHPEFYAQGKMSGGSYITCTGPLVPDYGIYGADPLPIPAINSSYWGARLISQTVPTNPVANVAQSLAELLREGITLPSTQFTQALKQRSGLLRNVGSEYLNVQFGWAPLINDMKNVFKAILQSKLLLENLERNSGLDVRRKRSLDPVVLTNVNTVVAPLRRWRPPTAGSTTIYDALYKGYPAGPIQDFGSLERTDLIQEQYSFSGAYSYYFENGKDPISRLKGYEQRINALLGIRVLTPEVLWELAPWSWLADYFADFGHLASNVTRFASDGLVMKYGYLMRHTISKRVYTQNGVGFNSNPYTVPFSVTLKLERKERVRATPFGFGLNPSVFTTRQWAILAALGLTKAPKILP